jgi:GAF domain-containing protein
VLRAIANSPHDLQPIFDTIADSARRLSRADTGVFRFVEETGFRLAARALSPAVPEGVLPPKLVERGTFHANFYDRLIASKSPIHVPDIALELHLAGETLAGFQRAGLRTLLFVPMLRKHEVIGSFALGRVRVEHFTDREIRTGHRLRCAGDHCPGDCPSRAATGPTADRTRARQSRGHDGPALGLDRP